MGFHPITIHCDRPDCRHSGARASEPVLAEHIANVLPLAGGGHGAAIILVRLPRDWRIDSDGRVLCPNHEIQDRSPAHVTPT